MIIALCIECKKEKEVTLTSLGKTCAVCLNIRRPRDTSITRPLSSMRLIDAFVLKHPKGEKWIVLFGSLSDEYKYTYRHMLSSKEHLAKIVKAVKNKTYNPSITFIGVDTQNDLMFPIVTVKTSKAIFGGIGI